MGMERLVRNAVNKFPKTGSTYGKIGLASTAPHLTGVLTRSGCRLRPDAFTQKVAMAGLGLVVCSLWISSRSLARPRPQRLHIPETLPTRDAWWKVCSSREYTLGRLLVLCGHLGSGASLQARFGSSTNLLAVYVGGSFGIN